MNATRREGNKGTKMLVDTLGLQEMLSSGRQSAVKIGTDANAKVCISRRVFWNVKKVQQYLDMISE